MKKKIFVLGMVFTSSFLLFPVATFAQENSNEKPQVIIDSVDSEGNATSGHINDDGSLIFQENNGNIQPRAYPYPLGRSIGGGTWSYGKMANSNQAVSAYKHRSKKHSATVTYGAAYKKAVRNPGTDAIALGTYKSGKNAYYWDNAPKESIGYYSGGGNSF